MCGIVHNTQFISKIRMPSQAVHRNLRVGALIAKTLQRKEAVSAKNGALVVYTGKYTGRSPKDKFIVDTPSVHNKIDWTVNVPMTKKQFDVLDKKINQYLAKQKELFIFDGFVGADKTYRLHTRVISEYAYQSLFSTHLLRRPTAEELASHSPQLTIISAPNCLADPKIHGTRSEVFIVVNMDRMTVLIGGTKYAGEIKKAIFTVMNILLPAKSVLPMHCSANVGKDGKTALFFGLSGTGKTTLSADPNRYLIGDDEHGWSKNGIFNFEGGCYAKCIHLDKESEPAIWNAIRHGSLVENVVLTDSGEFDFDSNKHTENTRAVYPIEHIENAVLSGVGGHPAYIIFLTADAFGVLPPVAKLSTREALYYFLSGYTSKLAETERGIKEPKATFSPFFGGAFMSLRPEYYTDLFRRYITKYFAKVYLVNTGWTGGPYKIGSRISIGDTRTIVSTILSGKLDNAHYRKDPVFSLHIPEKIPGIKSKILDPKNTWKDKSAYDAQAKHLVSLFAENYNKYSFPHAR
jgi:phosphoenolpyruvate carboxykinase (ATP)